MNANEAPPSEAQQALLRRYVAIELEAKTALADFYMDVYHSPSACFPKKFVWECFKDNILSAYAAAENKRWQESGFRLIDVLSNRSIDEMDDGNPLKAQLLSEACGNEVKKMKLFRQKTDYAKQCFSRQTGTLFQGYIEFLMTDSNFTANGASPAEEVTKHRHALARECILYNPRIAFKAPQPFQKALHLRYKDELGIKRSEAAFLYPKGELVPGCTDDTDDDEERGGGNEGRGGRELHKEDSDSSGNEADTSRSESGSGGSESDDSGSELDDSESESDDSGSESEYEDTLLPFAAALLMKVGAKGKNSKHNDYERIAHLSGSYDVIGVCNDDKDKLDSTMARNRNVRCSLKNTHYISKEM